MGRKIVDVLIKLFGLIATGGGLYFTALTIGSIARVVMMAKSHATPGLAAPALAIVGMFQVVFVFVFGFVAAICLSIGVWILEPIDRWRAWRAHRARDAAGAAATSRE
ncbi:MAG TPA: hypothetical protein VGG76_13980 [Gemmatimonadaceae bacterium]|jgi:hypothetical protein